MKRLALGLILSSGFAQSVLYANESVSPKEIVQEYFANLQSGKFAELMALLDDNIIWHQPGNSKLSGTHVGKDAVGKLFGEFMSISGGTFKIDEVKNITVNGVLVSANLHFSAHRCQYFDFEMSMDGVDVMKVVDGKIKEVFLISGDQQLEDKFWGTL